MTRTCPCGAAFELRPRWPHQRFCRRDCPASVQRMRDNDQRFKRRHPDYHRVWRANRVHGGVRSGARPCEGILA